MAPDHPFRDVHEMLRHGASGYLSDHQAVSEMSDGDEGGGSGTSDEELRTNKRPRHAVTS